MPTDEQKVSSCSFLLFQEFARLAEEGDKGKALAGDDDVALADDAGAVLALPKAEVNEPLSEDELQHQIDDDLVNVLTEDMDPRVTYRQAVSFRLETLYYYLS